MIRLWKIKRKSGNWQPKGVDHDFLERCLQCSDEDVRCNAFGVVCETSTLTNVQAWEYQLVKQFLVENVNYDRSNLRQSMVNYCVTFFLRVRGSVVAKQSSTEDAVNFVEDLYQFLSANLEKHCNYQRKMTSLMLYNAVLIYFGIGGGQERNQRKSNTKEKSGVVEEEATAAQKWHFRSKTSRKLLLSCIDDISDSVRNLAADILINHFKFDEDDQEELNHLYNIGKGMCSSKLFYEIESGALLIKTVTILAFKSDYSLISNMLKNSNPNVFNESKIIPTVTFDLINLAKTQLSVISKDIFMAVLHCHPLHGVLRALMLLLTDKTEFNYTETLKNSKEIQKIFKETKSGTFSTFSNTLTNYLAKNKQDLIDDIVDIVEEMFPKKCEAKNRSSSCELLEDIITIMEKDVATMIALLSYSQDDPSEDGDFALVNTPEFSPSFADMGNSLEEIVRQSEISSSNDEVLMLPVSHQLVLNCIWFNLKICCMLASGLITSGVVQCMEGSCCRCFSILETVLNKCRHKGAMDVAGSSMFSAAKSVMDESQQFSTEDRSLPAKILDNLLRNISADASCSLSRRSAGRAFLVHSIVASDPRPNSPLLGKTISKLIEIIGENSSSSLEGNLINDSLVDTPLVSALHILSTLVQDSRLNVLPFAKEIFCICFDKSSSPIYTVKNAALQLFKSLLMRLMRRMKGDSSQNDSDLDNYQTTPLQELFFHMPQLFSFVEKKLEDLSSEPDIITHAKLMPILVLLSNISITCFKKYNKKYAQFAHNIKKYVQKLFSSPSYFVRKLSARISVNLLLPEEMFTEVTLITISIEQACSSDFLDQNLLHGLVMNIKYLSLRLVFLREIHDLSSKGEFVDMFQCLTTLIKLPETTYFLKSLAVDVIKLWQPSVTFGTKQDNCVTINSSISHYKPHLGSSLWLAKIVENICAKDASSNLKKLCLLENNITDVALAFLRVCVLAPSTDEAENDSGLVMAVMKSSHEPEVIEQLMKKLLNGFVSNDLKLFDFILSLVKKPRVRYKFVDVGLGMLVACRILSSLSDDEFYSKNRLYKILEMLKCLSAWSSPSQTNEDLRNIAAECVPCFRAFFLKRMTTTDLIETEVFDLETDKLGSFLWQTLFNLLQDENLDIRMTACRFFPDFYSTTNLDVPNPFVALQKLMKIQFMLQMMNLRTAIDQLWNVFSLGSRAAPIETTSPFDHGIDNFYKDETWLHQTIQTEFKLISDESDFGRNYLKKRYQYTVSS
ncbi:thyroid adenoma-associated protein homolog [Nilaparvata lugens]|uniref:thyroid adenoma-associated protein homolog n=1 Tax=Nilaparvata lugens TaxID=108931 RepID=UPI00193DD41D|nr:thyroid adenoma-associated protein homolog [Nilaparvata lugens]